MISVIVPAYNAEGTIKRCLDSLICQTYTDIELIVVNDGSTDATSDIVSEMAKRDKRIHLVNQQNSGVSRSRNAGIDVACGELLAFVDADDTVTANYIEALYEMYAEGTLPVVDVICTDGDGSALTKIESEISLDADWVDRFFCGDIRYGIAVSACNKLFSTDTIRRENIRFDADLTIGEDMLFVFDYLCCCNKICFTSVAHYYYNIVQGSAMSTSKDYAPLYDKTFKKMHADVRIDPVTQRKWAFEATVDIMARPYVLNMSRDDFAKWWESFRDTSICRAAISSDRPTGIKRRVFHRALRSSNVGHLYRLCRLWKKAVELKQ